MARDAIAVTSTVRAGVAPALTTPVVGNGATMMNQAGRTLFVIISGLGAAAAGAGARTVVAIQVEDPYGRIQAETPLAVANDTVAVFGPYPPNLYNQSAGFVNLDFVGLSTNQSSFAIAVVGG